jgi:hypothetical protein
MEARPGVIETARAGIEAAIGREQLIPLDREKGFSPPGYMFSMNYPSEP